MRELTESELDKVSGGAAGPYTGFGIITAQIVQDSGGTGGKADHANDAGLTTADTHTAPTPIPGAGTDTAFFAHQIR